MSGKRSIKYGDIVTVSSAPHISSQGEACALSARGQLGVSVGNDIIYGAPVDTNAEIDMASFDQAAIDPFMAEVGEPDMEMG